MKILEEQPWGLALALCSGNRRPGAEMGRRRARRRLEVPLASPSDTRRGGGSLRFLVWLLVLWPQLRETTAGRDWTGWASLLARC